MVWKLDRWSRSVVHCVRSIQDLVTLGIRFLSPNEGMDLAVRKTSASDRAAEQRNHKALS